MSDLVGQDITCIAIRLKVYVSIAKTVTDITTDLDSGEAGTEGHRPFE